ncbi:hypothetical protein KI387_024956, partial [Taxus chinensis]
MQREVIMAPLHAVVVSFPAQGHITPLMNFAEQLAMRGFFITFVTTQWMDERLLKAASKDAAARDREMAERGFNFQFLSIPDGLPPEHGRTTESDAHDLFLAVQRLGPVLEGVLTAHIKSAPLPPITCIVSDSFMSCTTQVTANLGIPRVIFWACSTANSIVQANANFLVAQGYIPVTEEDLKSKDKVITCLPGKLPPIRPTDIVSMYREQHVLEATYSAFLNESRSQNVGDYVLVNTFEELEGGKEAIQGLTINGCPALAIGPGRKSMYSMREEDKTCLRWLDAQEKGSVLYVSFGSIAVRSERQLQELALGLEASGYPFLWVLRSDIAEGKSILELPEGFMERNRDRALLVSWTHQLQVLSHPSLGAFLTHSGWNSTIEAISLGDIWRDGLDFEGVDADEHKFVTKEEVNNKVRCIMEGSASNELRKNALGLKELASKAVMEGGSSYVNMNKFIEDMGKINKST